MQITRATEFNQLLEILALLSHADLVPLPSFRTAIPGDKLLAETPTGLDNELQLAQMLRHMQNHMSMNLLLGLLQPLGTFPCLTVLLDRTISHTAIYR